MKIFAQAAGLSDSATEAEIVAKVSSAIADSNAALELSEGLQSQLTALTSAIGEEGDKALGKVTAWKASHEQLAANVAELAEIKASNEKNRHADLVVKGKGEGKLTADLEAHFADQSADQLEAFLAIAPKVVPINEPVVAPPVSADVSTLKFADKSYCDLSGAEKERLLSEQPDLFAAMRADFNANLPGNPNAA